MVGLVSGSALGIENSSLRTLGQHGAIGDPSYGARAEKTYVNVATGNLVVQDQDEWFAGVGGQVTAVRTYNSRGQSTEPTSDKWLTGHFARRLSFGTAGDPPPAIFRETQDGASTSYTLDRLRGVYVNTDGDGAYDTISVDPSDSSYVWVDGATRASERYDANGCLTEITDDKQNRIHLQYANGRLDRMLNAVNEGFRFAYNAAGRLSNIRVISHDGTESVRTYYSYDTLGRLSKVSVDLSPDDKSTKDGDQLITTYTYDGESSRLASVSQRDGSSLQFTYVLVGEEYRVEAVTDGVGAVTRFQYDLTGNQTTVTGPEGAATTYWYDVAGQLTQVRSSNADGSGASTYFEYTAQGDVAAVTDPLGHVITMRYDAGGNRTYERDDSGAVIEREFDAESRLLRETRYIAVDPDGDGAAQPSDPVASTYVYAAGRGGQLRFQISPEGRVTEYQYGAFGLLATKWEFPAGMLDSGAVEEGGVPLIEQLEHWAATRRTTSTRTDYLYDHRGQVESRTTWSMISGDGAPLVEAGGSTTRYAYDHLGQLVWKAGPNGPGRFYTYDGAGRILTEMNEIGEATIYEYGGGAGRYVTTRHSNGLVRTQYLDKGGRLIASADATAAGVILDRTYLWYDKLGNLVMTKDPVGTKTWSLYDEMGRKTADIDARGMLREHVYSARGDLIQTIQYSNQVNTSELTDPATGLPTIPPLSALRPGAGSDRKTWYVHDAAGRTIRTVTLEDPASNLATVLGSNFDAAGRLISETQYATRVDTAGWSSAVDPQAATPAHASDDRVTLHYRDRDGLLVGLVDAEGYLTRYEYDGAGRIVAERKFATRVDTSQQQPIFTSLIPEQHPDDQTTLFFRDEQGQVVGLVDAAGYLTEFSYDRAGNKIGSIRYNNKVNPHIGAGSDLEACRPLASEEDETSSWEYDGLSRLIRHIDARSLRTDYVYDKAGNVVETVTIDSQGGQRKTLARYDLQGRLGAQLDAEHVATLKDAEDETAVEAVWQKHALKYTYDAAGHRTSSTDAGGSKTVFFYAATGEETFRVNAKGEVTQTKLDTWGRASAIGRLGSAITTLDLNGGVDNAKPVRAVAAIASPSLDSWVRKTYRLGGETLTETDAVGVITMHAYSAFGELKSSTQQLATSKSYVEERTYDRRGLLKSLTRDVGGEAATTQYAYDAFGRKKTETDALGRVRSFAYDKLGRMICVSDAAGETRTTYDAFDRTVRQVDALGFVTEYRYDREKRLVMVTSPSGITVTTEFDQYGKVRSVTDGLAVETTYTYDGNGSLRSTTRDGVTTSTLHRADGQVAETIDGVGMRTLYEYDAANRLVRRRVNAGEGDELVTTYQYDPKGQQYRVTDPAGSVTEFKYDLAGRLIRAIIDPDGLRLTTSYSFDAQGNVVTVTDPRKSVTRYTYDKLGRRLSEQVDVGGLNMMRTYRYDKVGNLVSSTVPGGAMTRYTYDSQNREIFRVDPQGAVRETRYDSLSRVIETRLYGSPVPMAEIGAQPTTDTVRALLRPDSAIDRRERRFYSSDGHLAATVDATGMVLRSTHDNNGNVVRVERYRVALSEAVTTLPQVDPAAVEVDRYNVYDAFNRPVFSIDGGGGVTAYVYDACGRVLSQARYERALAVPRDWEPGALAADIQALAGRGRVEVVRHVYDAAGRRTWQVDGEGGVTRMSYDGNGNIVEKVGYATAIDLSTPSSDASLAAAVRSASEDQVTVNRYDRAGRLEWTADGTGATTRFRYDQNGNLAARTNYLHPQLPGGESATSVQTSTLDRETRFYYDGANRLTISVDALGCVTGNTYDVAGNLTRETRYAVPVDVAASATADDIARALKPSGADRISQSAYDAAGRRIYFADAEGGATETRYNLAGQLEMTRQYATPIALGALGATASMAAWRTLLTTSAQDRVTHRIHDAAARLVYTVDPEGSITEHRYDGAGRVESTLAYAIRPATRPNANATAVRAAIAADPQRDRREHYRYDAAGNLVARTDALGIEENFEYDGAGRRTARIDGNRNRWSYTYDAAGRLKSQDSPPVDRVRTFELAGGDLGLEGGLAPTSIRTVHEYDGVGNLQSITVAQGLPEQRTIFHAYDALGRRTATQVRGVSVYDPIGDQLSSSVDAARHETARDLTEYTRYSAFGDIVAFTDGAGNTSYREYDRMGRLIAEADALGHVVRHVRNAFGESESVRHFANAVVVDPDALSDALPSIPLPLVAGLDRQTLFRFDRTGRVVEAIERLDHAFDPDTGVFVMEPSHTVLTTYNAFGDLIAVRDGAATSNHHHDRNGREIAVVDAEGHVSRQTYDALGNLSSRTEYANALTGEALSAARAGKLPATPVVADTDRAWSYRHDALGRKIEETLSGLGAVSTTVGTWNAIANVVPTAESRFDYVRIPDGAAPSFDVEVVQNSAGVWLQWARPPQGVTLFRWRRDGDAAWTDGTDQVQTGSAIQTFAFARDMPAGAYEVQVINDLGGQWLAQCRGKVVVTAEGAAATQLTMGAGSGVRLANLSLATLDGGSIVRWSLPPENHTVEFRYRATGTAAWVVANVLTDDDVTSQYVVIPSDMEGGQYELQLLVTQHGEARREKSTTWSHDAVGNITRERDAEGGEAYRFYDALGRLSALVTPGVEGVPGLPLTQFFHDAHGNQVGSVSRARGAIGVSLSGYTPGAPDAGDRQETNRFDNRGNLIQTTDAVGVSRFHSYDAGGRLAKSWQTVETASGVAVAFQVFRHDAAGRLTEQIEAAASGADGATASTTLTYDAFGNMTSRTVSGAETEWWCYDVAGRLWKTNEGDGVGRVILRDTQGRATMEIRSAGLVDVGAFASALDAWQSSGTRQTITRYDLLGQAIGQTLPSQTQVEGGSEVVHLRAHRAAFSSAIPQFGVPRWAGQNTVRLSWSDLTILGSGDVKVELSYLTRAYAFQGEDIRVDSTDRVLTRTFTSEEAAVGVEIAWADQQDAGGIDGVRGFTVYKKDRDGHWQRVIHQATQEGASNLLVINAPVNPADAVTVQWKPAGASASAFQTAELMRFGDALAFDLSGTLDGRYEYEVWTRTADDDRLVLTSAAALTLAAPPLAALTIQILARTDTPGILTWPTPSAGTQQTWRYRAAQGEGVWMGLPVTTLADGTSCVDTRPVPAGTYDFELLHETAGVPFAHAIGRFDIAGVPGIDAAFTALADGSASISWLLRDDVTPSFRYRPAGTSVWAGAAAADFITDPVTGRQSVRIVSSKAPGPYDVELQFIQGGEVVASQAGVVTVQATAVRPGLIDSTVAVDGNLPATLSGAPSPYGAAFRLDVRFSTQADGSWQLEWPTPATGATQAWFRHQSSDVWHLAADHVLTEGARQRVQLSPTDWLGGTWEIDIRQQSGETLLSQYGGTVTVHPPAMLLRPFDGDVGAAMAGNAVTGDWWITTRTPDSLGAAAVTLEYRRSGTADDYVSVPIPGPAVDGRLCLTIAAGVMPAGADYDVRIVYWKSGMRDRESSTQIRIGSSHGLPVSVELATIPVTFENQPDGTWSLAWPRPVDGITSHLRLSGPAGVEDLPLTRGAGSEFYADPDLRAPGVYHVELVQMCSGVKVGQYRGTLRVQDDAVTALPLTRVANSDGSWSLTWGTPAPGLTAHAEFGYAATTFRVNRDAWIRQNSDATMSVAVGPWDVVGEFWDLVTEDVEVNVYLQAADGRRVSQGTTRVRLGAPARTPSTWSPTPRACAVRMLDAGASPQISAAHQVEWVVQSTTHPPSFSTTANGGCRVEWATELLTTPTMRYRRWGDTEWLAATVQYEGAARRACVTVPPELAPGDYEFQLWNAAETAVGFSAGTLRVPQPGSAGTAMVPGSVSVGESARVTMQAQIQRQFDRWGNVIALTDPRQAGWITTFRHDLNDRVIQESRPGAGGEATGPRRLTSWAEHDALGRMLSSTDANGHTTRQRWDGAGNLVRETYADGASMAFRYDVFGDRIARSDELNVETTYAYDALSRLRTTTYAQTDSHRFDIATPAWSLVRDTGHPGIVETVDYDRAGRKVRQVNGAGEETRYGYDVRGNLTRVTQGGLTTAWTYDNRGRRVTQTDGEGASATWWYENFRLKGRTDIGGASYAYTYDHASQLIREVSNVSDIARRKDITYTYDVAGQLIRQVDASTNKVSEYTYDLAGNRITERTRQGRIIDGASRYVTYQDNELAYDALGRLRWVADGRARVEIDYDRVGNRTRIQTHVINGDASQDADLHFQYDVRDRQVVANAVNRHGDLGTSGHRIAYDKAGNKVSDAWQGRVVVQDPLGLHRSAAGLTNEEYVRDALGRVASVKRDGVEIDRRYYDAAGRVVQSGVSGLSEGYLMALNGQGADGKALEGNGTELRQSHFDSTGGLRMQQVLDQTGTDFKYRTVYYDEANPSSLNQDKAGNLLGYAVIHRESNENTAYTYTYQRADGYQQTDLDVLNRTTEKSGHTDFLYDGNGYLVRVEDLKQAANNRDLVNDAEGRLLYANQGGHVQRQLVANGEVFGRFGEVADEAVPRSHNGVSTYKSIADFDFAFTPAAGKPGQLTPSSHVVGAGDTLQSIAHAAYGDSRLWYRIAEANGVLKNSELISGQVLTIPQVELSLNGASTFKPYDAASAIGDTGPHVPLPSLKKSNWFGQLLALVVTIVVSAYMPGLLGANFGSLSTAMISSGAGSMAGQAVGIAAGVQERFNWQGVALSAVTAGMGEYVPKDIVGATAHPALNAVAKAAITSTASQAVAIAIGAQSKFDWRGVAAAGVGAGIGQSISDPLKKAVESEFMGGLLAGLVAGGAVAAMRGRKVAIQQVAMDAFGRALGGSLASTAGGGLTTGQSDDPLGNFIAKNNNWAHIDVGPMAGLVGNMTFSEAVAIRSQANDPMGIRAMEGDSASALRRANALWGPMPPAAFSDFSSNADVVAQLMRDAGYEGDMVPTGGGSVRVTPGGGGRPPMVNGVSVNERTRLSFEGADDLLGMAQMYRDYKLLGGLMNNAMQDATLKELKSRLQDGLGAMRVMPTPQDLGAVRGIGPDGAIRYDNGDLIDRYSDALRKVEMWKQGIIGLDTKSMLITWIGNQRMSPRQWVEENTQRYLRSYAAGLEDGKTRYAKEALPFKADMPQQLQESIWAHQRAELAIKGYNLSMGVLEGPGQLLSMNRWSYDPRGSGMTIRADMLLDLGPNRPNDVLRFVVDGKSSMTEAMASSAQFGRTSNWLGGASITAATPQGLWPWTPRKGR